MDPSTLKRMRLPAPADAALWLLYALSRVHMTVTLYRSDLLGYLKRVTGDVIYPEYGPLANLLIHVPMWLGSGPERVRYVAGMKVMALLVDAALFAGLMRRRNTGAALLFVAGSSLLRKVWLDRLDIYVGALLVAFLLLKGPARITALVAASLVKFPFLALAGLYGLRHRRMGSFSWLGVAASGYGIALAVAYAVMGPAGTLSQFQFHSERTLQVESLAGNLLYLGRGVLGWAYDVTVDHGAAHVHGGDDAMLSRIGLLVLVSGVSLTAWRVYRAGLALPRAVMVLMAVVAYTAFNPVGSPQFAVVVVALAPWAWLEGDASTRRALLLLVPYAMCADFGFAYYPTDLTHDLRFGGWTLARNLTLLGCWILLVTRRAARPVRKAPAVVKTRSRKRPRRS